MNRTFPLPQSVTGPTLPPGLLRTLSVWASLWSERRALCQLDDRTLADLGLTRAQACAEARRAPWDVPACRDAC